MSCANEKRYENWIKFCTVRINWCDFCCRCQAWTIQQLPKMHCSKGHNGFTNLHRTLCNASFLTVEWDFIYNIFVMRWFSVPFARQACGEFLHSGLSAWYLLHLCGVYRWKYQINRWSFYWSCAWCPIVHGYNFVANYIYQLGKISLLFSTEFFFEIFFYVFYSPLKGAEFEIFGAIFVVSQFYNGCVICNNLLLHVPWADHIGT